MVSSQAAKVAQAPARRSSAPTGATSVLDACFRMTEMNMSCDASVRSKVFCHSYISKTHVQADRTTKAGALNMMWHRMFQLMVVELMV